MTSAATLRDIAELEQLEAERVRRAVKSFTLEALLTHEQAFGLQTASPLQRAICRVADGQPLGELATLPVVLDAMGDVSALAGIRPKEIVLLSGIRTAKSLFAATLAVRAALTCDLSRLRPGETARVSVVSLTVDLARVVFQHLAGTVTSKPALRGLLIGEPMADSIMLRHPSGAPVEVKVVAGARAGASLVARWSAGCIFDEAPRMNGEEDGVVNFDDARRAVLGRLLPGAQLVAIGSPWAPRGPIYEAVQEHWHKPTRELLVIRAPAAAMNPYWWTPERIEELERQDEQAYRTDVLGEFADPETSLMSSSEVERATRKDPLTLEREDGHSYVAAMDPGTRGNAWTLVVLTRRPRPDGRQVHAVAFARQWIGSKTSPLNPDEIVAEVAGILRGYGLAHVWSDQYGADFLKTIGYRYDLGIHDETITAPRKVEIFESMRMRLADNALEIPDDPVFRADLLGIRKRVTQSGIAIDLPRTADGRHADYAAAFALALSKQIPDAVIKTPEPTTDERMARLRQAEMRRWEERDRQDMDAMRRQQTGTWLDRLEELAYGPQ